MPLSKCARNFMLPDNKQPFTIDALLLYSLILLFDNTFRLVTSGVGSNLTAMLLVALIFFELLYVLILSKGCTRGRFIKEFIMKTIRIITKLVITNVPPICVMWCNGSTLV